MGIILKEIAVQDTLDSYTFESEPRILKNLSRINILVGENNSGKSRFLRGLSISADASFVPTEIELSEVNALVDKFIKSLEKILSSFRIVDFSNILDLAKKIKRFDPYLMSGEKYFDGLGEVEKAIRNPKGSYVTKQAVVHAMEDPGSKEMIRKEFTSVLEILKKDLEGVLPWKGPGAFNFKRVYIPTLRGFRQLINTPNDLYADRTRKDYFSSTQRSPDIFTGYDFYSALQRLLLGDQKGRNTVRYFEDFLSRTFFQNKKISLIPYLPPVQDPDRKEIYINIDGDEKPVYDLGDGIQQIILLTFLCYEYADEPALFFIEEPELFLHPGMQRLLLECFSGFKNHQFFLASHSNHFLDISLDQKDISIYTFNKIKSEDGEPTFKVTNVSSGNDNTLKLLGVKNSSVFLSNCTIWIEGVTDRLYFKHYLNLYQDQLGEGEQKFIEDLHFSFVEYGGSNITHWSFLDEEYKGDRMNVERLCGKLFLITDRDDESKNDRKQALQATLGDRFYCLKRRESENLLRKEVLLAVLQNYKEKSFKEFDETDYKDELLGKFIDEKILENRVRKTTYADKSGTIKDKNAFCRKAINNIKSYNDLSQDAKDLTIKIYDFIDRQNKASHS